jgi:sulfite reductase (NADPH) flavoprotein alpha-component
MSRDVEQALLTIIQNEGKQSKEEAVLYLEEMELNGRYAKDVY